MIRAHRFSWEMHNGPIPDGMDVCHNCPGGDNPSCVNPAHLFLGTRADNNRDMATKGRVRQGVTHPCARLTEDVVRQIRAAYVPHQNGYMRVANTFGITVSSATKIIKRQQWKSVN